MSFCASSTLPCQCGSGDGRELDKVFQLYNPSPILSPPPSALSPPQRCTPSSQTKTRPPGSTTPLAHTSPNGGTTSSPSPFSFNPIITVGLWTNYLPSPMQVRPQTFLSPFPQTDLTQTYPHHRRNHRSSPTMARFPPNT
jgi:hypothetical protein